MSGRFVERSVLLKESKGEGERVCVGRGEEGDMTSAGDCGVDDHDGDNAAAALLIVGVKPDDRSREVLTWALVNVARPGDRIVALHVLDYAVEGSASLIALVRTFDTMLGVYESFCNLKQVDLKLKVCRGKSARKVLVEEANSCRAASLIVGSSRKHHKIRSSVSMAKYCARNLAKDVSVFAVRSGKIMFRRVATVTVCESSNKVIEAAKGTDNQSSEKGSKNGGSDDSMALVAVETSENNSGRPGWTFLRRLYLRKRKISSTSVKMAVLQWVSRLRGQHSASVIHPDQKQRHSVCDEDYVSSIDGEDVTILQSGSESVYSPLSPFSRSNSIPEELEGLHERYSSTCRLFTYDELSSITSNFSSKNLIGEGGSSYVYRGCLPDGRELAVKILKPSLDVSREFMLEIEVITSVHHHNIISLFGFCFENNNLILVYDYLPRGSLEENLHGDRKDGTTLGWPERYKVAIGIAEALDYLHNRHDPAVIHRDVKSSNVLLSDDYEPQLSDFGFASMASSGSQRVPCVDLAGTFGYLAPEYFMHGKVTDKNDVYAFGVVLLELISGRKPICSDYPKGQESLVMWAKPILGSGKGSQLIDPNVGNEEKNERMIEKMVLAATLCIRRSPQARPHIGLVLKILKGDEEAMEWGKQQQVRAMEENGASPAAANIESHINMALLDLEDNEEEEEEEIVSDSSSLGLGLKGNNSISVEDYLKGRWSRTASFQSA